MAISCVVEYSEDYGHERFYGITPVKRQDSMGYQGRSPWLVRSEIRRPASHVATAIYLAHRPTTAVPHNRQPTAIYFAAGPPDRPPRPTSPVTNRGLPRPRNPNQSQSHSPHPQAKTNAHHHAISATHISRKTRDPRT